MDYSAYFNNGIARPTSNEGKGVISRRYSSTNLRSPQPVITDVVIELQEDRAFLATARSE